MASERSSSRHAIEEEEEDYDRPRPRRRFRGFHWRHPSTTYIPPPPQSTLQQSPPRLRPLSVNLGQSGFDLEHESSSNTLSTATIDPQTPPSTGSYSYCPLCHLVNDRAMSKSFANELSKVFNIDEDPAVEELECSVREKSTLCRRLLTVETND
jgi:hypothetical protein